MGYRLDPGEITSFCSSANGGMDRDCETYRKIDQGIELFSGNQELQGEAWGMLKMQLANHQTILKGLICINEMMAAANEEFAAASGGERLDEDQIQQGIIDLEIARNQYYAERDIYENLAGMGRNSYMLPGSSLSIISYYYYKNRINQLDQEIYTLSAMLETLYEKKQTLTDIINATKSLYAEAESLCASVSDGLQALENSWTGNRYSGIMDCSWAEPINQAWNVLIAEKVTEALKSGDSIRYLEYEEFAGLSEEEQQEYMNGMLALLFAMEPGLSLSVGDKIEVPIGPDMKMYYEVEGSGNWKEESAWEIDGVIKEQQIVFDEFATNFGGFEVSRESVNLLGIQKEYIINDRKTVTFKMSVKAESRAIQVEYETDTKIEDGSIISTVGIEKNLEDTEGWERVPEPVKAPIWSWDLSAPDTGDNEDFGLLEDVFNWISG